VEPGVAGRQTVLAAFHCRGQIRDPNVVEMGA
jgi:hypothetical protein